MATKAGRAEGKALAEKFRKMSKDAATAIEEGLQKGALRVERDAKINAPVDTGRLRASISTRLIEEDGNTIAEVGSSVEYAPMVEYGTSKKAARPFLFPAYNQNKDKIRKDIAAAVRKSLGLR